MGALENSTFLNFSSKQPYFSLNIKLRIFYYILLGILRYENH